jgi:hypothetical protein
VAEPHAAGADAGDGPADPRAMRAELTRQLGATLDGSATLAEFAAWWGANDTEALLGSLTYLIDPGACKAIDLCGVALADHRAGKLEDEDLYYLLGLARRDLRG